MDGVHEYLLEAQMDLVNSNLLGWWFKHSNGVEYKILKIGFWIISLGSP